MQQYFTSSIVPIAFFLDVYCLSFENYTIFCQKKNFYLIFKMFRISFNDQNGDPIETICLKSFHMINLFVLLLLLLLLLIFIIIASNAWFVKNFHLSYILRQRCISL